MRYTTQQLWQAAGCLVGAAAALLYGFDLEGTEFSGGSVTGPLLKLLNGGCVLFVLALPLAFVFPRIAGSIAILAGLLCLPICMYFIFPGAFRSVFHVMYVLPLTPAVVWDLRSIGAIVAFVVAAFTSIRNFSRPR